MLCGCHVYLVERLMLGMVGRIGMELDQACKLFPVRNVDVQVQRLGSGVWYCNNRWQTYL